MVSDQSQTSFGDDQTSETTQLLRAWADGDRGALERLTPRVYRTLRRIAGHHHATSAKEISSRPLPSSTRPTSNSSTSQMSIGSTVPISSPSQHRSCGTSCSTAPAAALQPNEAELRIGSISMNFLTSAATGRGN